MNAATGASESARSATGRDKPEDVATKNFHDSRSSFKLRHRKAGYDKRKCDVATSFQDATAENLLRRRRVKCRAPQRIVATSPDAATIRDFVSPISQGRDISGDRYAISLGTLLLTGKRLVDGLPTAPGQPQPGAMESGSTPIELIIESEESQCEQIQAAGDAQSQEGGKPLLKRIGASETGSTEENGQQQSYLKR